MNVSASSSKCDFIIQSPITFFPALLGSRNEFEDEVCHDEVGLPAVSHRSSSTSNGTVTFNVKARRPLGMMNIHRAATSVRISAFRVAAAPSINTIKHIGEGNMLYVNASSFKLRFHPPIFRDVFSHTHQVSKRV